MELTHRDTAFITGGSQGIGLGIARALANQGVRLALADIDGDSLRSAEAELGGKTEVLTVELDVRDREAFQAAAEATERQLGPVSVLVNNAGVGIGVLQTISQEIRYEVWDYVLGVNLEGMNNGVTTFVPRMLERGGPCHIVNTASAAGLVVFPERSSGYTYHASKFAVIGLTEALRRGFADEQREIGASVLIPGMVATNVGSNSLNASPESVLPAEARERLAQLAGVGDYALATYGRDIDSVGEMVVDGIQRDRLYIPTDRLAAAALEARTKDILAAMPSEASSYDDALGQAMRSRSGTA
ncbi:NADP-dependent 3-hydroxy acid dehydrogenase YdfG [Tamaricihabitans halophyticus]|uniref:NADP-dependent 3-hydroxy acid dehydrogenase YdfG n=1 Tax=Tamaricihabitans halophyticus TaxID=1262583 RepID=A0A4R2R4G2_9PSEU|nr:SDR family NAD(P)-dependent oxidoreductase [Tamaricihabitans halophyticus]TCP56649.1 NADP-dependent 3-hydroxy acid dehydrogenase YdfG [Tamaricihabitans halophyticus]